MDHFDILVRDLKSAEKEREKNVKAREEFEKCYHNRGKWGVYIGKHGQNPIIDLFVEEGHGRYKRRRGNEMLELAVRKCILEQIEACDARIKMIKSLIADYCS